MLATSAVGSVRDLPGTLKNAPTAIATTMVNAPIKATKAVGEVGKAAVGAVGTTVGMVGGAVAGAAGVVVKRQSMEFGETHEIYTKLEAMQNPTLDEIIKDQKDANTYDPYESDSDDDVDDVKNEMKGKHYILEEKVLKLPPDQDFSQTLRSKDKTFANSISQARHKTHGLAFHLFNDHVYKVDTDTFPSHMVREGPALASKRNIFGMKKRRKSMELAASASKKAKMTPYEMRKDELDGALQINKYSHSNPWINRIAVIVQPMVEIIQVALFASRAMYNAMTWQDPILSFWIAFGGPLLVLVLHGAPYRLIFFLSGIVFVGPQNWVVRLFRESRPDYAPPDFDTLVKKKKVARKEGLQTLQFFSSQAPGNQEVKYKDVDPKEIRQVIVPDHKLMATNRFYDWPPEPEYAKVYSSFSKRNPDGDDASESNRSNEGAGVGYWFDPALAKKKKKKKKGLKKVAHLAKKGAGGVIDVGGALVEGSTRATVGVVKGATEVTKSAVKGTGQVVTGMTNGLRRRSISKRLEEDYFEYE